ncbi:GNAT family N-acetyltransferase, partial [Anaerolineae bacterium AMX1]|nr:GNAT family N-acetyltransferase [Anaerolineae bacterium AMX1]
MVNNYSHLENCDPYRDMLMAEVDGQMVGYNRVFWEHQEDGARLYVVFGFLLPEWRRKGLGSSMLALGEARLREIAAEQAYAGPRFFQSWA